MHATMHENAGKGCMAVREGAGLTREFTREEFFGSSFTCFEKEDRPGCFRSDPHPITRRVQGVDENSATEKDAWQKGKENFRAQEGHVWPTSMAEGSLLGNGIVYRITSRSHGGKGLTGLIQFSTSEVNAPLTRASSVSSSTFHNRPLVSERGS